MMKTVFVYRTVGICVVLTIAFWGAWVFAQSAAPAQKPVLSTIPSENPFDFVLEAAESPFEQTQARSLKSQKITVNVGRSVVKDKLNAPLQYRKKFYQSPEQAQTLYKVLVKKYGEPKSVRGQSHVWDIKNPNRGVRQADIVTIIMKMQKNGGYELIMDRDRGENGLATWAAPRLQGVKVKPVKQQKSIAKPILQPDND